MSSTATQQERAAHKAARLPVRLTAALAAYNAAGGIRHTCRAYDQRPAAAVARAYRAHGVLCDLQNLAAPGPEQSGDYDTQHNAAY